MLIIKKVIWKKQNQKQNTNKQTKRLTFLMLCTIFRVHNSCTIFLWYTQPYCILGTTVLSTREVEVIMNILPPRDNFVSAGLPNILNLELSNFSLDIINVAQNVSLEGMWVMDKDGVQGTAFLEEISL